MAAELTPRPFFVGHQLAYRPIAIGDDDLLALLRRPDIPGGAVRGSRPGAWPSSTVYQVYTKIVGAGSGVELPRDAIRKPPRLSLLAGSRLRQSGMDP